LSKAELNYIDENSVVINYKKQETVCKQGSFVSHIMFIEQGLVKVYMDDGSKSLVLKVIPEGNLVGLTSLSEENNTYLYSAMTYVESEIKLIDINAFRKLVKQNAEFAKEVIDILTANSIQISGRFFCLTHKQAYGRLADILLCLSRLVFKQNEFELPLSRKELGELSGMTAETMIRMIKKFIDDGLIEMNGKRFKVLDYERLLRISEKG
jgi:CRP/FNR family transcriptional regulator